jgi:anti-anti-sigma factor
VFSVDLATEGTSVIITLAGELDLSAVEELREFSTACLLQPSTHTLIVDLGRLTFLDCAGLGGLVELKERARGEAKRFELRSVPARVNRLLILSGTGDYFTSEQATIPDRRAPDANSANGCRGQQ